MKYEFCLRYAVKRAVKKREFVNEMLNDRVRRKIKWGEVNYFRGFFKNTPTEAVAEGKLSNLF